MSVCQIFNTARSAVRAGTVLLCMAMPVFIPASARAQYGLESEDLILAVKYDPYILSEGILGFQKDNAYYLPVVELAEIFGFLAEADLSRSYISGFYNGEDNRYFIDIQKGEYGYGVERKALPAGGVLDDPYDNPGEFYIRSDILDEIWPVGMTVNLSTLMLEITTTEKLAFERRLERELQREKAKAQRRQNGQDQKLPFVANPYGFFSKPSFDFETTHEWDDHERELTGRTAITGVQDIAGMSADYSASLGYEDGTYHEPENIRLRFTKEAFGDDKFFLGLKQVQAGDVRIDNRTLINSGTNGRGVFLTNAPGVQDNNFDEVTIEGTGLPGWEVEIYRNELLIDSGVVDAAGEYRFTNVPLNTGNNQIRVVLYGPQGQVRERVENYEIGGAMVKPGKTRYTLGVVDADRDLLVINEEPATEPEGGAMSAYVSRGVNENLTVFSSASRLPTRDVDEKNKSYVTGGAVAAVLGGLGQAEFYQQAAGGHVTDLRFNRQIKGIRLNLQSAFYNNFESPDAGFDSNRKTYEGEAGLNTDINTFLGIVGLQLTGRHTEAKFSDPLTLLDFRQSLGRSGLRLTNQISATLNDYAHTDSEGRLSATVRINRWQWRSEMDYAIHPDADFSALATDLRYTEQGGMTAGFSTRYDFENSAPEAGFQIGYDFGSFLGSFETDWMKDEGLNFILRASTSFGVVKPGGRYGFDSDRLTRFAPVQGRVFLDVDGDGILGEGDTPLPEARLSIDGRKTEETTDKNGLLVVLHGGGSDVVNLELDRASLSDPYYMPVREGYSTVPRPGSFLSFDFPVVETGAVDGTVTRTGGAPVSGMKLQLINDRGESIMETESAYDGFYSFEFVPPGTYTVRADPSYGVDVPPAAVTVASEDLFVYGADLQLQEQAAESGGAEHGGGVAQTHLTPGTGQPAPSSDDGAFSAVVSRIRIGEHPDRLRLVLDLSGPVTVQVTESPDHSALHIDLPGVAWDALRSWRGDATPVLQSFETEALAGGGTRLTLRARTAMLLEASGSLEPSGTLGYRLYFDFR